MKSIVTGFFLLSAMMAGAAETGSDREWKNVWRELEKIGVRVDHFAKTPLERERELAGIRRQMERANDPTRSGGMRKIGGGSGVPSKPKPARPGLQFGKIGQKRPL